jgi:hypothetical protein
MPFARHPSRPLPADERGIALLIALLAIIVIGALVTGTFFAGRMEMQSGRNSVYTGQATEMAETGLTDAFASWNSAWNEFDQDGDSVQTTVYPYGAGTPADNSLRYTQIVRRMAAGLYLVTSRGEKLDQGGNVMATRLLARLGKLIPPWVDVEAAVTSKGNVTVSGNNDRIDGHNNVPPGWAGCSTTVPDEAGIRTSGTISTNGSPTIDGDPPRRVNDATVVDSLFQNPYAALLPYATVTINGDPSYNDIGPSTTDSPARCDPSNDHNWGEPGRAGYTLQGTAPLTPVCQDYYPVIVAPTGLKIQFGRGQGVLLVGGDLDIRGNFEFDGIIIALGQVKTEGTGNKITGAVLANNTEIGDLSTFAGNPTVLYSQCAVATALRGTAKGFPLTERSWAQVNTR